MKPRYIQLPNCTLIALTGLGYKTEEHLEAIQKSVQGIDFGAIRLIQLHTITDIDSWNKAVIYELYKFVETDFCILIHHDGYIIHPELWRDEWLQYDYIGAPFPWPNDGFSYRDTRGIIQRVGNSVSLRSKRLIELAPKLKLEWRPFHGFYSEDGYISVNMRHIYEENGMKFAPLEVAKYFSKEHDIPENKGIDTFAFHAIG